jgi:peptidoglycan pentaglycine glycine transferase (the first glycine)
MIVRDGAQPRRLCTQRDLNGGVNVGYQIRVSYEIEEPEWDAFLAETPGGHHVQTSLWAQVKALLGWCAARIVVTRGERIVAGAQLLIRPLPLAASAIGYVPKGPLLAVDDPLLAKLVINELHEVAKAHHIQYLVVQPPSNGEVLARQLPNWGFRLSSIEVAPAATVLLDLTKDLDDILAQMKSKTRYNLRLGQRKGITTREGGENDLHAFYYLLIATSQRQKFSLPSKEYFVKMWRVFNPHGYVRLFLAEYEGETVSALLAIPFRDTVLYKRGAWSGYHGSCRPNEVLQWAAIEWAKSQGYQYYDFEGIKPEAARAILRDEPLPGALKRTVTSFKVGFGGQVTLFPRAYDYVYDPVLRWVYTTAFPKISSLSVVERALNYLRTH